MIITPGADSLSGISQRQELFPQIAKHGSGRGQLGLGMQPFRIGSSDFFLQLPNFFAYSRVVGIDTPLELGNLFRDAPFPLFGTRTQLLSGTLLVQYTLYVIKISHG
jgi:hypothetical protein